MKTKVTKISLFSFILMILISTFGFNNTGIAYNQMGYSSIIWYVLTAVIFFLPCGLMFAEYGSAFKNESGGLYSWLKGSVGEKIAFIGTFTWYASWIVWMISMSPKIWIPFSTMLSGHDNTQAWHLFDLTPTETIGILAIFWMLLVTWCDCKGIKSITRISSLGGTFIILVVAGFCIASLALLLINHGHLAEPIHHLSNFTKSPNPSFQTFIPIVSFIIYAMFAYGGIESLGGMIDKLKDPARNFPLGIIIGAVTISITYAGTIFLCGISTNWTRVLGHNYVNLGNVLYVIINNLGYVLGKSLGLSTATAVMIGKGFDRFAGLGLWLGYGGSFFVLLYSPLKSFIMGASKHLLPSKLTQLNKHQMPANALWIQAVIVIVILLLISFSGSNARKFYLILTDMTNLSMAFPYLFLVGAFPFFKRRKNLTRPFVFYK
ncbi:MAG: glutamate/gamma-aminobutyrate family transporter YjeM [Acetilactobacillus jinshanensis]